MELVVHADERTPDTRSVEVVERKGLGHPDTICDALAEQVSIQLSRYYLEQFGAILHHNVDKILLCAGAARPAFGGGRIVEPIALYLAGRAVRTHDGVTIPVDEIAVAACRGWLRRWLPELDVDRDVTITPRIRPGSTELPALFRSVGL